MKSLQSHCHDADVEVMGTEGSTRYYICTQCEQPCDVYAV